MDNPSVTTPFINCLRYVILRGDKKLEFECNSTWCRKFCGQEKEETNLPKF